jgi:hypothetical protein
MSIVLQSSGGGQITVQEPATASNFTQTLPAASGDVMVSGNMPAFRATLTANQTISHNTTTKIQFNSEIFDTNSNYDPTTNYRFTPTVAGYYQVDLVLTYTVTNALSYYYQPSIYKNGSSEITTQTGWLANAGGRASVSVSGVIYMNGSSDYLDFYTYNFDYTTSSTVQINSASMVSAALVRAA